MSLLSRVIALSILCSACSVSTVNLESAAAGDENVGEALEPGRRLAVPLDPWFARLSRLEAHEVASVRALLAEMTDRRAVQEVDEACRDPFEVTRIVDLRRIQVQLDGDVAPEVLVAVTLAGEGLVDRCEHTWLGVFDDARAPPLVTLEFIAHHCTYDDRPAAFTLEVTGSTVELLRQRPTACGTMLEYEFELARVTLEAGELRLEDRPPPSPVCFDRTRQRDCESPPPEQP